jgi:hypothetical protein
MEVATLAMVFPAGLQIHSRLYVEGGIMGFHHPHIDRASIETTRHWKIPSLPHKKQTATSFMKHNQRSTYLLVSNVVKIGVLNVCRRKRQAHVLLFFPSDVTP